ncbi:hypothetical protein [Bacillus rubiinfantis]|uniref:hypothetical protein n=1 Tax=Bacillus rubiinfantis TaxID=1499680 RepID=UPI000AD94C12|nr:hypothetical protein [Bacillus rubiinfantis]
MGCCSPEYRKIVKEQEAKINDLKNDTLPLKAKILIGFITAAVVVIAIFSR